LAGFVKVWGVGRKKGGRREEKGGRTGRRKGELERAVMWWKKEGRKEVMRGSRKGEIRTGRMGQGRRK
jgi:hypothetical protein